MDKNSFVLWSIEILLYLMLLNLLSMHSHDLLLLLVKLRFSWWRSSVTIHLHFLDNRVVVNSLLLIKAIRTDLLHLIFKSFDVIDHVIDIFTILRMVDSLNVM